MIISSIDIMNGMAVQLRRGCEKVLERGDINGLANRFNIYGEIAVIDLDRARQTGDNSSLIRPILATAECRVGGGIRTAAQAREWISLGACKVIVGTAAFAGGKVNRDFLHAAREAVGRERLIVAVDARGEEIVTSGWQQRTGIPIASAAKELEPFCDELLFTCVDREGTLTGIDMKQVEALRRATSLKLTVAGGVATLAEIERLAALRCDVQLGMALYTGKIDLQSGFAASLNWPACGLLPTIVQDRVGRVLMLAYSNRESLQLSFAEKRMWYWSRSRSRLWLKGETSGNFQELIRMRADCDGDTLLATVRQEGVACHQGSDTCFGRKPFVLRDLEDVIRDRRQNPRPASYTAALTEAMTREKLLEEAHEIVSAIKKEDVIWEAADVLYFLLVYLAQKNIQLEEVLRELQRRRSK